MKHRIAAGLLFLALVMGFTGCVNDPCTGASPELCGQFRAQVAGTATVGAASARAQATQSAIDAGLAAAKATAIIKEANAEADRAAAEIRLAQEKADREATLEARAAEQQATITQGKADLEATTTTGEAYMAATATLTAIQTKSHQDTLNAIGMFVRDVVFYAGGLTILFLACYWAVNYIRRKSAISDTPAGTILVLPSGNPFAARLIIPLLAERAVIDSHDAPERASDDTIRRKQVIDLALAAARANADVVNEADVIEGSGWAEAGRTPQPELPAAIALPLPSNIDRSRLVLPPPYREIAASWRPTAERMLLGYTPDGQPLYGKIDDLLSVTVIGRQGTGKTTLERFIYVQCVQLGARVIVWDPHDDIVDSLPGTEACIEAETIQRSASQVLAILNGRRQAKLHHEQVILVIVDEYNALVHAAEVAPVIQELVTQGRKYRLFCIVSVKGAPAASFGGAWIRDAFSAHYAFNCRPSTARQIGFDGEAARQVELLRPGEALLEGSAPPQMVLIPQTTIDDVRAIFPTSSNGNGAGSGAGSGETVIDQLPGNGLGSGLETGLEVGSEMGAVDPQKLELVRLAMMRGASVKDILQQVFASSTSGSGYKDALAELRRYQAVIASQGG
ncbi:MAG: hypothetical protein XU15_C0011G0060 [candidate division NC10 bacterium CSP1-5]|nr:MAG: hypothetical protein XU15_C0011G0060 [candidate division NC10 bacterium CSP1-5]